ncbi:MAG: hypothetical protein ACFB10_05275 [Salibacteraceae bacterium]
MFRIANLLPLCFILLLLPTSCRKDEADEICQPTPAVVNAEEQPVSGTQWEVVVEDPNSFTRSLAVFNDQLIMSYSRPDVGTNTYTYSAHYDGVSVTTHPSFPLTTLTFRSFERFRVLNGSLFGMGAFYPNANSNAGVGVLRYNPEDNTWTDFVSRPGMNTLVYDMAFLNGIPVIATNEAPFVLQQVGGQWVRMGSGFDARIQALQMINGELFAAGHFQRSGSTTVNHIARWNGSDWEALDEGLNGAVYDLALYEGKLVAGGTFNRAGTLICHSVAVWNGSSWSALGDGIPDGAVFTLKTYANELLVGGRFQTLGGINTSNVGRWNGTSWRGIAFGLNTKVEDLEVYQGKLYAAHGSARPVQDLYMLAP